MARRSKYTPDAVARIIEAIEIGSTFELAAEMGGISKETFYQWMKSKPDFSDAVTRAEGEARMRWLKTIDHARVDDWRAAAWMLERRYPQHYGKQAVEVTGSGGGALKVEIAWVDSHADADRE